VPFNIGAGEILLILLVALIVLGPDKLPNAARQVGRTMGELRRLSTGFQSELKDALKEPIDGTPSSAASAPAPQAAPALPPPAPAEAPPAVDAGPLSAPKRPEPAEGSGTNGASPAT
jgi:sec-independent protein translocase protein TatB